MWTQTTPTRSACATSWWVGGAWEGRGGPVAVARCSRCCLVGPLRAAVRWSAAPPPHCPAQDLCGQRIKFYGGKWREEEGAWVRCCGWCCLRAAPRCRAHSPPVPSSPSPDTVLYGSHNPYRPLENNREEAQPGAAPEGLHPLLWVPPHVPGASPPAFRRARPRLPPAPAPGFSHISPQPPSTSPCPLPCCPSFSAPVHNLANMDFMSTLFKSPERAKLLFEQHVCHRRGAGGWGGVTGSRGRAAEARLLVRGSASGTQHFRLAMPPLALHQPPTARAPAPPAQEGDRPALLHPRSL